MPQATAWLSQHADEYGAACEQLVISGHSAGGHLTAMLFATDWATFGVQTQAIRGGIAISGLFDLEPLRYTHLNTDLQLDADGAHALSPIHLQPTLHVPMVVTVGALETSEFLRQSQLIADTPTWQTVASQPVVIPKHHHFNILDAFTDLSSAIWQQNFFRQ